MFTRILVVFSGNVYFIYNYNLLKLYLLADNFFYTNIIRYDQHMTLLYSL